MLPQIANGTSSKMWIVPTEFTAALGSITKGFGGDGTDPADAPHGDGGQDGDHQVQRPRRDRAATALKSALADPTQALAEARRLAEAATADATSAGTHSGAPTDPSRAAGQQPAGSYSTPPPAPRTLGSEGGGARFAPPVPDAPQAPTAPPAPPVPPTAPDQGPQQ